MALKLLWLTPRIHSWQKIRRTTLTLGVQPLRLTADQYGDGHDAGHGVARIDRRYRINILDGIHDNS